MPGWAVLKSDIETEQDPWASQVAQRRRTRLPEQETRVRSLGGEDPQEEEMATHSSILAWIIPRTEEPGGLQSVGPQRVGHATERLHFHFHYTIGPCCLSHFE